MKLVKLTDSIFSTDSMIISLLLKSLKTVSVAEITNLLVEQVTGSVCWRESVGYMAAQGVDEIWEVGAGKALSGMVRRIAREVACRAVGTPDDVKAAVEAMNAG